MVEAHTLTDRVFSGPCWRVALAALLLCLSLGGCSRTSPSASAEAGTAAEATAGVSEAASNVSAPAGDSAARVRALTGAPTRVVWVQSDGTDPFAAGDGLVLMGFDTEDGRGERIIRDARGSYVKPMLTARGERIVYSTRPAGGGPHVFVVNWDGSGHRRLAAGFALAVWQDPKSGRDWVYLGTDNDIARKEYDFRTVSRFPLDRPDARELMWNKTPVSGDTFQVSVDGRHAGGLFPWPHAGVAELPNGELQKVGEGCWTAMRDAGPLLCWYFDGAHRNVNVVEVGSDRRWTVRMNRAPGFANAEVYHPRWTNHPRVVALSGPYNQGGRNQVRSGGAQTEIYLGRFNDEYSRIESWARVTENSGGDSYPDVWVDVARSAFAPALVRPAEPARASAPKPGEQRVVVSARLASATEIPTPRSIAPYRNALVVNGYEVVDVIEGRYDGPQILVAQWAIHDGRVLTEARRRQVGSVARLELEPYDTRPELEGERLIEAPGGPELPIYYDAGSRP